MALSNDEVLDFELIRRMADQSRDSGAAREAWGEFYVRHNGFLRAVCRSSHGSSMGEWVNDIVHDTFMKAFRGASGFNHRLTCEPEVQRSKSRAWLTTIAENLVRDHFRGKPEVCFVDEDEIEDVANSLNELEHDATDNPTLDLLKSGFAMLSDVEQTVLRSTMFWWQANREHQRMPETAMLELSKQTGKSASAIRQIRSRAMRKLQSFVIESLSNDKAE